MSILDMAVLFWALPSLLVTLTICILIRLAGLHLREELLDKTVLIVIILYPLGVVACILCFAQEDQVFTQLWGFLTKERSLKSVREK